MKHLMKTSKSLCALILSVMLIASMPIVASAADSTAVPEEDLSALLVRINSEYGTNFHILSDAELADYGLTNTEPPSTAFYEVADVEETLRYIAEVKIPQFERTTQEAIAVMASIGINSETMAVDNGADTLATSYGPITARRAIDYAVAGARAYVTEDALGNTVWGSVVNTLCETNVHQEMWFLSQNPSVTRIDARRTLYWTGTGDYGTYVNGQVVYLYSGTQYTTMYVGNYA